MNQSQIIQTLTDTGALLEGHFVLRSGLHSNRFFQAALVMQYPDIAEKLCSQLADKFSDYDIDTVVSPAIGGIVVGQEVARALGARSVFVEKIDDSTLELRRGFSLSKNEKVLIAEDVITRGGRVQQTIDTVTSTGANLMGAAVLVDRSAGSVNFNIPVEHLIELPLATYSPDECPLCKRGIQLEKPGSGSGKK